MTYFCSSLTEEELFSSFFEEEELDFAEELLTFAEEEELLFSFLTEEELFAVFSTDEELFGSSAGALEPESSPQPASIKPSAAVRIRDL
jgi:hypothetical protein